MKIGFIVLSAVYLCSLYAGEKIMNKDFYGGSLDNWYAYCNSSADNISMKRVGDLYNVLFTLTDGGNELWEALLTQPIAVRPGYRYHLSFGGVGTEGAKTVDFGLCHNGSPGEGGDGSEDYTYYTGMSATLPGGDYAEFKVSWENTDVDDDNVRVYIQGGGNSVDYQIAWVSVWEAPLDGSDEGRELVTNVNFSTGDLEGWYALVNNAGDKVSLKAVDGDYDVLFTLADGGEESWEVQLIQSIGISAGKRYSLAFGGVGTGGSKKIEFGLCHNGATAQGGDGSDDFTYYAGLDATLPSGKYAQFTTVWDNVDIDDNYVRVYLHGGGNAVDFQISWVSVWESPIEGTPVVLNARMNQLGFFRGGAKRAVLTSSTGENFEVRDTGGTVVYSGTLSAASQWEPSGETVRIADFSELTVEGSYALYCNDIRVSGFFTVASNPLEALAGATIKAYYYQRASTALTSTYAGAWARSAGHSDKSVTVHSSAGSGTVSAPKGWYDAGDYGKYIISSGFTVYTLLALYEHFPDYCAGLKLTIPENGNSVPDILDEVRWNVDWMLAMQDDDGGVYSKLTTLKFAGTVMPEDATAKRYVFMKTTASALDFAAVTAQCSRVYQSFDSAFASKCLDAAKAAYAWANEHPSVKYVQPADCQTGDYNDTRFTDEFLLASVELAVATGDGATYSYQTEHDLPGATIPSWQDVGTLGLFSICSHADVFDATLVASACKEVVRLADALKNRQKNGYSVAMSSGDFYWGSNCVAATQGIVLLYTYYCTGDASYRTAAEQQVDYLLGRNPLSTCYVTGFGTKSPLHPHHRIAQADGVAAPPPGLLVGGPNPNGEDTAYCTNYIDEPATSWLDSDCSYASNEIAINWNAAVAYLNNAVAALHTGHSASGFLKTGITRGTGRTRHDTQLSVAVRPGSALVGFTAPGALQGSIPQCTVFNMLGRNIAEVHSRNITAETDGRFTAEIPYRLLGKGYFVVRWRIGKLVAQKGFVVK